MDHTYIDENQVAERYLMGRLSPVEAELFEDHSLGCAACLDRLEAAEELRLGLRQAVVEQAVGAVRAGMLARLAGLARLAQSRRLGLVLAGLLVVALLPSGLLLRRMAELDAELGRTREALSHRPPAQLAPAAPVAPVQEAAAGDERRTAEKLAAELAGERERSRQLAEHLALAGRPQVNLPLLTLGPERSAPGGAEPTARLELSPSATWIVLSLELPEAAQPSYRATLVGPDGKVRWQDVGLTADAVGNLSLALPAGLLAGRPDSSGRPARPGRPAGGGDFQLRVDGLPAAGQPPVAVAVYAFRVTAAPAVGRQ